VISGGVMGAGAAKSVSAVRWGVAGNIVVAWILTIPAAAIIGAAVYGITRIFGASSAVGPIVVSAVILAGITALFLKRAQGGGGLEATT
jgi:inorganic phosphate transporter, PiT family